MDPKRAALENDVLAFPHHALRPHRGRVCVDDSACVCGRLGGPPHPRKDEDRDDECCNRR